MSELILKGCIIHTPTKDKFEIYEDSYLCVKDGLIKWLRHTLEKDDQAKIEKGLIEFKDYKDRLIIPSFIDLHLHAPQFIQMGLGLDLPLIDWLDHYTFKIEERFVDVNYGKKCYPAFAKALYDNGTLRSVIFGTIHKESNEVLVEEISKLGLSALVGKVNMNRFTTVNLTETLEKSVKDTIDFIDDLSNDGNPMIKPIVTPRFAPSCSGELLEELGSVANSYQVPVQSHLCETKREIGWVKELFEDELSEGRDTYSDVYLNHQLLGNQPTVMAHGIYMEARDIELAKKYNVFIAHCPTSNMNLTSGIMPLTRFLDDGVCVGLGSDIGAGHTLAMNQVIVSAIQNAKIRNVINDDRRLEESEAFYLATKGNGLYMEQVFGEPMGSFEPGSSFDALIIHEEHPIMESLTPMEQLQRYLYCGRVNSIEGRYLRGKLI